MVDLKVKIHSKKHLDYSVFESAHILSTNLGYLVNLCIVLDETI